MSRVRQPPSWALYLAMALGAGLALVGVFVDLDALELRAQPLPEQLIARVGEQALPRADYERAVAALEADLRRPLNQSERREVVEGLIDELLLVEHGLATGLPQRDPYLRTQVARGVLDGLEARSQTQEAASEAELRAHYERAPQRFSSTGRVELEALWIRGDDRARAEALAARWSAGEPWAQLRRHADPPALPLPTGPLAPSKLRDYLGPELTMKTMALEAGEISAPLAAAGGLYVLRIATREVGKPLPFEQVREAVATDLERSRSDVALRELLDELRGSADIEVAWNHL